MAATVSFPGKPTPPPPEFVTIDDRLLAVGVSGIVNIGDGWVGYAHAVSGAYPHTGGTLIFVPGVQPHQISKR